MINDRLLLDSLTEFFSNEYYKNELLSILGNKRNISLRSIDWFITNYSKKYNIYYNIYRDNNNLPSFEKNNSDVSTTINVFHTYKSQLKAYSKKRFDPFCRRDRINFKCGNDNIETTIGQLNFFKWAISNLILEYIFIHKNDIEEDMNKCLKEMKIQGMIQKKPGGRKLRQELSLSATRGLARTVIPVRLEFD
tara:strand:+ start:3430 stop:4008 length:579 start_codon:yes stop_codon:yes gene_type:complete